ncbi:hypothetical protein ONZ43_g5389 [Nemania bipapillata]|uniref:Uncharacterized protein n=1 Tax=Nemania bipapillata TaxID=110536 RepID=A0ACC2IBD9_9PEZI|nr:hypothetical protein ONZ43_g5389 [Nemania bipapillata]
MLDPLGLALFTGALVSLILALQISGVSGWVTPAPIVLVVVFAILLGLFFAVQTWLQERGTLPPRIARMPQVIFASAYAYLIDSAYYVVAYFLPIWFQAVKGISARDSGIRLLPIIIAAVLASIVSGIVVSRTGHYALIILFSSAIAATGCGLLSTMDPGSGAGAWIGYQTLVGVGVGLGMQQAAVVVQNKLDRGDIPTAISAVTLFQALGSAVMVSITQNVFANRVYDEVHGTAPNITRGMIINTGATELIDLASSPDEKRVLLNAVSVALTQGFYVATAGSALAGIAGLGMGFKKLDH